MKKSLLLFTLFLVGLVSSAQYFQATMKVELTTTGPEAVFYIKANAAGGDITDGFAGVEFFITSPPAYALSFGTIVVNTADFPLLSFVDGGQNSAGITPSGNNTYWWYYSGTGTTTNTYTAGIEYEVLRVPVLSSTVDFGDVSMEFDGSAFSAYWTIYGKTGTLYTTVDLNLDVPVYYGSGTYTGDNGDVVFTGGNCMYTITDQPLIPMVMWQNAAWAGGSGTSNSPGNGDAAKKCYVKDLGAQITDADANVLDLIIEVSNSLEIVPNAALTAAGPTTISDAATFTVQADATGVGSFIDNGSISYGPTGTAKVQTYLANGATSGFFHIHMIGPTVDKANYTGTGTGVLLSAFNVAPGSTYAYAWDEPTGVWLNLVSLGYEVPTAKGIALSTTDATDHTLTMTGELITGITYSEAMTTGGAGLGNILLSNPYPSSIFWNDMYTNNSGNVNDAVYVWDAGFTGGNYRAYNQGSGGTDDFTGYIQVGQGFFVESTGTGNFSFSNTQRHHSIAPFYAPRSFSNRLDVRIAGANYQDGLLLHFYEDAHAEYEANEDVLKMDSRYAVAPEIWTDLQNGSRLSINAMPVELLGRDMLTVPLSFDCGLADTYTLTFNDVESFESGTEIWLEDKQTGAEWVNLNEFPEYIFTGAVGDLIDRFYIHFFGPTRVNEITNELTVNIYSYGQYAYVVNDTDEIIENILLYNLSGALMMKKDEVPDQRTHNFWVSDRLGYFIVKVITEKNTYIKKVLISN